MATNVPANPKKTSTTEPLAGVIPLGSVPNSERIMLEYNDKRLIPVV